MTSECMDLPRLLSFRKRLWAVFAARWASRRETIRQRAEAKRRNKHVRRLAIPGAR